MVTGDNEELMEIADKICETYTLEEFLEYNEITYNDLVLLLLEQGWVNTEIPHVL